MAKKTGTSTGAIEQSPRYKRRRARQRRAEEAAWAARSGPVVVYSADVVRSTDQASSDVEQARAVDPVAEHDEPGELIV